MFNTGQRVKSLNGRSQGAIVRQGEDHVVPMLNGPSEIKRRWFVQWDGAPDGLEPQLEFEESLVATETTD